jgi:carboxypeptidase C (cathepsin A)
MIVSLFFKSLFFVSYLIFFTSSFQYTNEALLDQITELPGLNWKPKFQQFSGYLNLPGTEKFIHYWLVESYSNPETDPLVFWTNGGPGCSGLIGFMTEQGPFRPDSNGNLNPNIYAWNKIANMVFLEQPVGVGFSYSNNKDDYKIGDDQAAKDNLATILTFLDKFPHFNHSSLFITSESYGGHYMPTLANEIINFNDVQEYVQNRLNFKGFAVGNPYTNYYSGVGAEMETYWGKQLLPKPLWDKYIEFNCTDPIQQLNSTTCSLLILNFMGKIGNLNPYALDYPVCLSSQQMRMRNFLRDENENISKSIQYEPCEDLYSSNYLNKLEVKLALHINSDIEWEDCSRTIKYNLADKMLPMEKYYRIILNSKTHPDLRVLVYSGDDDSVCGTIGTQKWIYDLGYPTESLWETWYNNDGQTAGFKTKFKTPFGKNSRFSFLTVHDAGHEVPTYKPKDALELFDMYINNKI